MQLLRKKSKTTLGIISQNKHDMFRTSQTTSKEKNVKKSENCYKIISFVTYTCAFLKRNQKNMTLQSGGNLIISYNWKRKTKEYAKAKPQTKQKMCIRKGPSLNILILWLCEVDSTISSINTLIIKF